MFGASCVFTPSVSIICFSLCLIQSQTDLLEQFVLFCFCRSLWNAAHLKLCNNLKNVHRPIRIKSSTLLTVTNSGVFGFGKSGKRVSLPLSRETEAVCEERDVAETHESVWISTWASASPQRAQIERRLVFSSRHTSGRHWDGDSKTLMEEGRRRWQWRKDTQTENGGVQNGILTICRLHSLHWRKTCHLKSTFHTQRLYNVL